MKSFSFPETNTDCPKSEQSPKEKSDVDRSSDWRGDGISASKNCIFVFSCSKAIVRDQDTAGNSLDCASKCEIERSADEAPSVEEAKPSILSSVPSQSDNNSAELFSMLIWSSREILELFFGLPIVPQSFISGSSLFRTPTHRWRY
jgi:hypothetical protein